MTGSPIPDPFDAGVVLCWCGLVHRSDAAADLCTHMPVPYVPGQEWRPPMTTAGESALERRTARRAVLAVLLGTVWLVGIVTWWAATR